jgi:hypothetical protein
MQVLESSVSRAAARNEPPASGLFLSNSEGIQPNWIALFHFHLRGSRSPRRNPRQQAWHARQAALIAKKHLPAKSMHWTWQAACAEALAAREAASIPLT